MNKIIFLLAAVVFSQTSLADVTKEVWSCKDPKGGSPAYLNVTIDRVANKIFGAIDDKQTSGGDLGLSIDINNKEASDPLYALSAEYNSWDHSFYRIELVPTLGNEESLGDKPKAKGTAVVFADYIIDCLGQIPTAVISMDCEIQVTSSKQ